jgi:hypothetical protein
MRDRPGAPPGWYTLERLVGRIGSGGCQAEGHGRGLPRISGAVNARAADAVIGLDSP